MFEKISETIDRRGDAGQRRAVFDRILADGESRKRWRAYHLIGNVLRGEVEATGGDLSGRIGDRLADEPTLLAPLRHRLARRAGKVRKPALALALAASLVLAVVVVFNPAGDPGERAIADARHQQAVDEMLAQHGEFTSSPALNGLVAYAKLVSSESVER